MQSPTIELDQDEVACLLFWHEVFKNGVFSELDPDRQLFGKLKKFYEDIPVIKTYLETWTPLPRCQPGGEPIRGRIIWKRQQ